VRPIVPATAVAVLLLLPSALALTTPDLPPYPLREDDAGSGRDAGTGPATAVPILPGVVYRGDIHRDLYHQGIVPGDYADWYSFDAPTGALLDARLSGLPGCLSLWDAAGSTQLASSCSLAGQEIRLLLHVGSAGRHHLAYSGDADQTYFFSFALDAIAPEPARPALPLPHDDAGSGRDAGNDPREAVPVSFGIAYDGFGAGPYDPADWYSFPLSAGDRLQVQSTTSLRCDELLRPDGSSAGPACSESYTGLGLVTLLDLVADASGTWTLGLPLGAPQSYRFSLGLDAPAPDVRPAEDPTVYLDQFDHPQDDAGSGRDAGNEADAALPISPGAVYRGEEDVMTDLSDWYSFHAEAGQSIRLPISGSFVCADLYDPGLVQVANVCTFGYSASVVSPGWVASSSGTWRVHVETVVTQTYAFALALDAKPPALPAPVGQL